MYVVKLSLYQLLSARFLPGFCQVVYVHDFIGSPPPMASVTLIEGLSSDDGVPAVTGWPVSPGHLRAQLFLASSLLFHSTAETVRQSPQFTAAETGPNKKP